ncbi:PREDICTED: endoplasmic reticulum membrane-associated RNA degradation protein-like isoform X2 [Priapulus caudatus]|uniref:Endoplasmic reticulum membrane-associated RNA degradation protein-like isoform X2 n=1 Tax=Priapulus caudatus TaxID=37621 RepID=A0ABM1EJY5_PRICU|nr:PREDICTED: endoplasmic reticulum membrane-associated RNA degradation protein-like isoform X2 [Priapulus caudatus]
MTCDKVASASDLHNLALPDKETFLSPPVSQLLNDSGTRSGLSFSLQRYLVPSGSNDEQNYNFYYCCECDIYKLERGSIVNGEEDGTDWQKATCNSLPIESSDHLNHVICQNIINWDAIYRLIGGYSGLLRDATEGSWIPHTLYAFIDRGSRESSWKCLPTQRSAVSFTSEYPALYTRACSHIWTISAISHVNCQPDLWKRLVHSSCFVTPTFKPYWELALHLLQHGRHGYGLALLLPQLEHGLRRVFTTVNKCQERMLTAENTVLFTTFDEMLLPQLADGRENKLMSAIGESYMMVLFDLLVHTDGPRIRDKLSHGEINFSSLPLVLFDHVSALCLAFCSACLPSDAPLRTENGVYRLLAAIKGYESIFHPRSALVRQIKDCSGSLSTWSELCVPDDRVFDGIRCSWSNVSATEPLFRPACQAALSITQMSSTFCDGGLDKFVLPFEHIVKQTQHLLQGMTGSTLYRPKAELELIGLLRCIVQNCTALSEQLQNGLNLRFRQLQEKELRSRQRATYQRALESITSIGVGTRLALVVVCYVLDTLEHRTAADDRHKTARCLKRTLQYVENLRSMTHPTRNRWMETRALTEAFIHSFLIHDPAPISGLKSLP